MPKQIETYWTYEILSIEGERSRSLVIAPNDTLREALAGAFKDATYYIAECGYTIAVAFEERCRACNGDGSVPKRRSKFLKAPCKVCKGKPLISEIPEAPWVPHRGEQ